MKLHSRTMPVHQATSELNAAIMDLAKKYDLSWIELAKVLTEQVQTCLKYLIRQERHPDDPEKKGDEE